MSPPPSVDKIDGEQKKIIVFNNDFEIHKDIKIEDQTWSLTASNPAAIYQIGVGIHDILSLFIYLGVAAILGGCIFKILQQNTEIKQIIKQRSIELNKERLSKELILNSVGDGLFSVDTHGNTTMINDVALNMIGCINEDDVLGKNIHDLIQHSNINGTKCNKTSSHIFRSYKLGEICHVDNEIFWRKSGISMPVEYTSTPILEKNGEIQGAVVAFKDITERRAAELDLKAANTKSQHEAKRVNFLQSITTSINETDNLDDAISLCIKEICKFIEWDLGHAFIFDKKAGLLNPTKIWYGQGSKQCQEFILETNKITIKSGIGLLGRSVACGLPIWLASTKDFIPVRAAPAQAVGIEEAFTLPILVKKEVVAVLEFFSLKKYEYNSELMQLFGNVATQLGRFVERKQAEEEISRYTFHLEEIVNERTKELTHATDEALSANKAKTEFLANISHELRTPMHAILSYSDLGIRRIDKADKAKQLKYLTSIHESGKRLLSLLDALLDLSKLEAGQMDFYFENHDLRGVLENVTSQLFALSQQKHLSIEIVEDTHNLDMYGDMDENKISQVIWNLLSNAIKFSPENASISIIYEHTQLNTQSKLVDALCVTVSDVGVGIPDGELDTIFDKFIQSSKTKTGAGGTGLGLSVSKEIIENHGGKLWAQNNLESGASFMFAIPISQGDVQKLTI